MRDYRAKKTITHEVDGQEMTFTAVPMKLLFELRTAKDGVAKAMASFMSDNSKDISTEELQTPSDKVNEDGNPFYTIQTVKKAAEPSVISMRARQREEGIGSLLELLCSEDIQDLAVRAICQSCSDLTADDAKDFLENVDVSTFKEFATGTLKACAGAFGNLGNFLSRLNLEKTALKVVDGVAESLGADKDQD